MQPRWLITGLNGTLAPVLARSAQAAGIEVLAWNRAVVPADDSPAARQWLAAQPVDAIAHLAMGAPEWAALLARHAAERGLPMLFTSTAMVFDAVPDGPHELHDERTARDDYGRYKMACEDAVLAVHGQACVARIGWQIDPQQGGNNMLRALDDWQAREGEVAASRAWTPACSFMEDTAAALLALVQQRQAGLCHIDSNAEEAHRFDAIVRALQAAFDRPQWRIRVHDDYRHDQRLIGGAESVPPLSHRLPALRAGS